MSLITKQDECDSEMIETLVGAAVASMERNCIEGFTTPSDILSASFTLLERTLDSIYKIQTPTERVHNTREVARILREFMVSYGQIPS